MVSKIIEFCMKNRALVLLVTAIVVAIGVWGMINIRLDAIPDLSDVQVIIVTKYAGQNPQVVQDQVTYPLTTAMLSVPNAKLVRGQVRTIALLRRENLTRGLHRVYRRRV